VADKATVPEEASGRQIISLLPDENNPERTLIYMNMKVVAPETLTEKIEQMLAQDDDLRVFLRADRAVKYLDIKNVMSACADAGIVDVIFGVFESGD